MIGRVFAPRLRKAIDTRAATIAEDLANARANRDEAEAQDVLQACEPHRGGGPGLCTVIAHALRGDPRGG